MYLAELQYDVFQNECVRLIRIILECEGLLRDFRVVARFGKSRHAHISTDCSAQMTSSVVFVVAPTLPLLPILEGKFINLSDFLFRSPG